MDIEDFKWGLPVAASIILGATWGAFAKALEVPVTIFYLVTLALGSSIALGYIMVSAMVSYIGRR